jgi:hypothetical protein
MQDLTFTCGTRSCCIVQARQVNAEVIFFAALRINQRAFLDLTKNGQIPISSFQLGGKLKMTAKLTVLHPHNLQTPSYCPTLQQQVWQGDFKVFKIPGGQVIWWHCPECQGWHVAIQNDQARQMH